VHGLETELEQQAWHVLTRAQSSMRIGPMGGCMGLDMTVVLSLARAFGYPEGDIAEMVGSAQSIIIEKMKENSGG
jgi:hypothetical protein